MSGIVTDFDNQIFTLNGESLIAEVCLDISYVDEWYGGIPIKNGRQHTFIGGDYRVYYIDGATKLNELNTYWNQKTLGVDGERGICAIEISGSPFQLPYFVSSVLPPYWTYEQAEAYCKGLYADITLPAGAVTYGYRYNYGYGSPYGSGEIRYAFCKLT